MDLSTDQWVRRRPGALRIRRHTFARPRIAVHVLTSDVPSQVTIGIDALRHFPVTIDAIARGRREASAAYLPGVRNVVT